MRVKVGQKRAVLCKRVQCWSTRVRASEREVASRPVRANISPALVVRQNEDRVWLGERGLGGVKTDTQEGNKKGHGK